MQAGIDAVILIPFLHFGSNFKFINILLFRAAKYVETRAMYVQNKYVFFNVNVLSRDWLVMSKIRFRFRFVVRKGT